MFTTVAMFIPSTSGTGNWQNEWPLSSGHRKRAKRAKQPEGERRREI